MPALCWSHCRCDDLRWSFGTSELMAFCSAVAGISSLVPQVECFVRGMEHLRNCGCAMPFLKTFSICGLSDAVHALRFLYTDELRNTKATTIDIQEESAPSDGSLSALAALALSKMAGITAIKNERKGYRVKAALRGTSLSGRRREPSRMVLNAVLTQSQGGDMRLPSLVLPPSLKKWSFEQWKKGAPGCLG